jgi:hypothetical protein
VAAVVASEIPCVERFTGRPEDEKIGRVEPPDDPWTNEAIRLHRRYQQLVERLGFCPWAERARRDGRVRERVLLHGHDALVAECLTAIDELAVDAGSDVAFIIFPHFRAGPVAFDAFRARVQKADAERREVGSVPFVLAGFHPDALPDASDPERLIPFLRRSPDPTLQLLRASVVDAVRHGSQGTQFVDGASLDSIAAGGAPAPLRERIARANLATAERIGIDVLCQELDEIRRDRDATYAALARR